MSVKRREEIMEESRLRKGRERGEGRRMGERIERAKREKEERRERKVSCCLFKLGRQMSCRSCIYPYRMGRFR
jgi:hypothetical protein